MKRILCAIFLLLPLHVALAGTALTHTSASAASVTTVTTPAIDTTGADFAAVVTSQNASGSTGGAVTDSKGNTCTQGAQANGATYINSRIWYCPLSSVGTGHTFTFSISSGIIGGGIAVQTFSGSQSSPLDQTNSATGTSTTQQPGSITPTTSGQLIVTSSQVNYPGSTATIGGSFTIGDGFAAAGDFSYMSCYLAYYFQPTAGAINPTWTFSNVFQEGTAIASFKFASAASNVFNPLSGRGSGAATPLVH